VFANEVAGGWTTPFERFGVPYRGLVARLHALRVDSGFAFPPVLNIVARLIGQLPGQQTPVPAQPITGADDDDDGLPSARIHARALGELE